MTKNIALHDYISCVVKEKLEFADCDGCTRCVAYLMKIAGIKFKIWTGQIATKEHPERKFPIHYWIEDEQGEIWDFKSYKWLRKESQDCIYYKRKDVTDEFEHGGDVFRVMMEMSNTIGREQDELWEKQTGQKLHRKV